MPQNRPRPTGNARSDERRLVQAAQDDPTRFAELYDLHFDRIYAFVARRTRNRSDVEDLTSEIFYEALASLPRFEWRGVPFSAWLFRIAANTLADHARRGAREQDATPWTEPAQSDIADAESHTRLHRLVDRLPADQRRVLHMRFTEEKTVPEIARELDRSRGAVKQLQFRALETLRTRLNPGRRQADG